MIVEGRYMQVSDTGHGCRHEKLSVIIDDGKRLIQCECLKRWESETDSAAEAELAKTEAQIATIVEDICQMLRHMTDRTREMVQTINAYRARWKSS